MTKTFTEELHPGYAQVLHIEGELIFEGQSPYQNVKFFDTKRNGRVMTLDNIVQITTRDLWFEDPASPLYNQYLRIDHEPATPVEQKAQMKQGDHAHSLKLFIAHNAYPRIQPGAGSSIFFHIWRNGGNATTFGCTTMSEENLKRLIAWVVPERRPLYVLLPEAEYARLRPEWKLP